MLYPSVEANLIKNTLNWTSIIIPAKAGTGRDLRRRFKLGPGFRRDDEQEKCVMFNQTRIR